MGRLFVITLEGNSTYTCKFCDTHLALAEQILSKSFQCSNGIAYLFDKVVNITTGEKEDREMMTGVHTVVDIFCVACGAYLGWKYEAAYEKTQKYKEGKFILERFMVLGPGGTKYTPEVQIEESDDEPEDDEPEDDELDDA